jgi:hypothetical protein
VSEKTAAGTLVGNVLVRDVLSPQRPVTLSALQIADDSCGLFAFADDGATLVTLVPLDYETTHGLCTLTLHGTVASDNCQPRPVSSIFDVALLDENEPPVVNAAVREIMDSSAAGTVVAALTVFDEDVGQVCSCVCVCVCVCVSLRVVRCVSVCALACVGMLRGSFPASGPLSAHPSPDTLVRHVSEHSLLLRPPVAHHLRC